MATTKKLPQRMCTGCGEMKPKRDLVRIVHTKDGDVLVDDTGRVGGRGAYLCRSLTCLQAARKARRLEKAFSCRIPDEVYEALEKGLSDDDHAG
ncbi:MAG: YlxR family protein [Clostridia bacterium]|nr:YlxR family protein [Clostridia bacterium]